MAIIFTFGISDTGISRVQPDPRGQLNIQTDGNCNVMGAVKLGGVRPMPIVFYGANVRQPEVVIPEKPSLVFNQITDGDTHRTALKHCHTLCAQLDLPVINAPEAVIESTREKVAERLADIPGVTMPRTIAGQPDSPGAVMTLAAEHGLEGPFIARNVADYAARNRVLVNGPEDLDKLHAFGFDGKTFYLTEWVDYATPDGLFHKHRIAMVDGVPVVRHSLFGEHWLVDGNSAVFMKAHPSRGAPEALAREVDQRLPKAADAFTEIHRRMGLDYFGIDCHIDADGQVLVFGASADVDPLTPDFEELNHRIARISSLLHNLVESRSGETLG